ncbi:MAG: energy transducer TonB [Gammaproteobacteria bacterium]|nr:energy transducer TonB [Gammaproteobacteria bacterium]
MLIEPERYSAWKLYADVLRMDPNSVDAREGIFEVGEILLARATTALEQGRIADAREVLALVQRQLPDHADATELGEHIDAAEEAESARVAKELAPPRIETTSEPVTGAVLDVTDPLEELRAQFDAALAAGDLLRTDGGSARTVLGEMAKRDADHALTSQARVALVNAILSRAFEAIEDLDAVAARTWIDAARELGADTARADGADAALTMALVTAESQRLRPAAELTLESYTAPRYPLAAERREIAGWVDVEFVVTIAGQTRDVTVADASHDNLFREEAVAAVESWRFEPTIFLDRPIEQRAYTRIRFALQ